MTDSTHIIQTLISQADLNWFDSICSLLKKDANPTTHKLEAIIGTEKPNPKNEIRGSKFLDPFDKRFRKAFINPYLTSNQPDQALDYLGFWGDTFKIKIGDIHERFKDYKTETNIYDGGTQILFYPVSNEYEFTAIDCWTGQEKYEISNLFDIEVNNVEFKFGNRSTQKRLWWQKIFGFKKR